MIIQAIIYFTNWFAFVVQIFQIDDWFEHSNSKPQNIISKILSYLILPALILSVFMAIYISSSEILNDWYKKYELNIDAVIILVALLGFYLSFVFWNAKIYEPFKALSRSMRHHFTEEDKINLKPTFQFLEVGFEKRSGIITLFCLNLVLFSFIIIFNVEHFIGSQNMHDYSSRIHEQINSLIGSIFLAIVVILFYFKGALNFIQNNKTLVILSKFWVGLNGLLILSAVIQNTIYINALGLTYKRLGVYLFLILCGFGLFFTYLKIHFKKNKLLLG